METLGFWKTKESENVDVYFHGNCVGEQAKVGSGDTLITQNGDVFRFIYGVNNTDKEPYMDHVKKINVNKFPEDNNVKIENKVFSPLGIATIYKLKNGKFYWEY